MDLRTTITTYLRSLWWRLWAPSTHEKDPFDSIKPAIAKSRAAAREHQTKPETRRINRPVRVRDGIPCEMQYADRLDANGVPLERPARPAWDVLQHGVFVNGDGTRRPRTVLQGCEGSHWPVTGDQVLRHLREIAGVPEGRYTANEIEEFLMHLTNTSLSLSDRLMYENPIDGPRILRCIPDRCPTTDVETVDLDELEAWARTLEECPVPVWGDNYWFYLRRRGESNGLVLRLLQVFGGDHVEDLTLESYRNQRPTHPEQRDRERIAQIAQAGISSGWINPQDIELYTIRADRLTAGSLDFVSSGTDPLPANENAQIESSPSDQGFTPRARRMRIRGRQ